MVDNKRIIRIAGAGVSGLTAGIVLAAHGFTVEILEQGRSCGERFHDDFQGLENWSSEEDILSMLERYGISTDLMYTPFRQIEFWTGSGKKRITGEKNAFYVIRRGQGAGTLDTDLLTQAKKYPNLTIRFRQHVQDFSNIDIVAVGPNTHDTHPDALASGYMFEANRPDFVSIIFDDTLAPDGYGYCIIIKNHGVITTVAYKNLAHSQAYLEKLKEVTEKHLGLKIKPTGRYSGIGNFFLGKIPPDRKIYTGEAGGMQDMLWGFGMRYAFTSGYLAARSIIDNTDYYLLIKNEIQPMMVTSVVNRLLFAGLTNVLYKPLTQLWSLSPKPVSVLGRVYRPTISSHLLFPIANMILHIHTRDPRIFIR